ncbi:hypothetical protein Tco_1500742 [Tanacetum coccineum]
MDSGTGFIGCLVNLSVIAPLQAHLPGKGGHRGVTHDWCSPLCHRELKHGEGRLIVGWGEKVGGAGTKGRSHVGSLVIDYH